MPEFPLRFESSYTMRFFRAQLLQRTVTCLIVAVLGAGVVSAQARTENDSAGYAAWITLHLPGNIPAGVELALIEAESAQPRSLDTFLDLFFSEIEKNQSEQDFMEWLYGESADHSTLTQNLRFRLLNVVTTGLFWRSMDNISASVLPSSSRPARAVYLSSTERISPHLSTGQLAVLHTVFSAGAKHLISVAQPQGP